MLQDYPSAEELAAAAAGLFRQFALEASESADIFTAALSGGTTPERMYLALSESPFKETVPWEKIHFFWSDERYVPLNDSRSNAGMAFKNLLDKVPVPKENIHPVPYLSTPEDSALEYEKVLRSFFSGKVPRFHLVMLGMGEDGHTASLFPHTDVLKENERWVREVYLEDQKSHRITLTYPAINSASNVVFLIQGKDKAPALSKVLKGTSGPEDLPARGIHPLNGELYWLIDREALSPGLL
ncbi:MAG: 6-phosphogluconolactonase [Ignavibacteria bacterium]|nr:6-phosphogluconolactonase [Ignavibacteria bacterium]MCU7503410.1 6-phosphogluconolactonase [Ignavibacteria bacterium]MCU7516258.1 6-phosphogluconolactonase [Ignavibacteria bacterium]